MSQLRIAYRYAEAFFTTAEAEHVLDVVVEDMKHVHSLLITSRELRVFLKSPVIKKEKKRKILIEIFSKKVSNLTMHFLQFLAEKGREGILNDILSEFFRLHNEHLGIVEVHVSAVSELTKNQLDNLVSRFGTYTSMNVKLNVKLDKSIIGGFVAQIGDTMFDGSVRHQLDALRKRFIELGTVG